MFRQGKFLFPEIVFAYLEGCVRVQTPQFLRGGYPVAAVSIVADLPIILDSWPLVKQRQCRSATVVRLHLQIENRRILPYLHVTTGMASHQ